MKILLVEDSRTLAAVMASRLSSFGHQVQLAENGLEALVHFEGFAPDLILMDIEMPEMNGFEACARIRAIESTQPWAWTPIIFLTASDTPANLVTAIEAGADDFMAKTVPEAVLHARMRAMSRIAQLRHRLAQANQQLESLAHHDGLTGLYNRRYLDLHGSHFWFEAMQAARGCAVLMIDLDQFKPYNDHYGHLAGDDVLRAIGAALNEFAASAHASGRARDAFAARYGGEEFCLMLPYGDVSVTEDLAHELVLRIRQLALPHEFNRGRGVVTISVGAFAQIPAQGNLAEALQRADQGLYQAKESGGNRALVIR